ncbi:MAG: hypothetical protein ABIE36_03205 [Candidatus Diapherotrites archaeon]
MVEVISKIGAGIIASYNSFINFFPPSIGNFINFLILILLVSIYAIIIWNGYRFISKKDPLGLNLSKYNKATNPLSERIFAGLIYFLEYLIIIPFVIFCVLAIFTIFLIVLSPNENTFQILIISSTIIAVIRMTSYYKENLSQEIAKILPFILLATFVLNPSFISQSDYLEKIVTQLIQIPSLLGKAGTYFFFILILELILRLFDLIFSFIGINESEEELKEGTNE